MIYFTIKKSLATLSLLLLISSTLGQAQDGTETKTEAVSATAAYKPESAALSPSPKPTEATSDSAILPVLSSHSTDSGLRYDVHKLGSGPMAVKDKPVVVHYTGWLDNNGKKSRMFDSSRERGSSFLFYLGRSQVIKGWEEGIAGMKVGERRTLYVPAKLAYGAKGAGERIPPNSDLIFDVELLDVY